MIQQIKDVIGPELIEALSLATNAVQWLVWAAGILYVLTRWLWPRLSQHVTLFRRRRALRRASDIRLAIMRADAALRGHRTASTAFIVKEARDQILSVIALLTAIPIYLLMVVVNVVMELTREPLTHYTKFIALNVLMVTITVLFTLVGYISLYRSRIRRRAVAMLISPPVLRHELQEAYRALEMAGVSEHDRSAWREELITRLEARSSAKEPPTALSVVKDSEVPSPTGEGS